MINSIKHKILIVDDDQPIRLLIERFLGYDNHYEVATAGDAKTARQLLKSFLPDLVILDVNLPDDSGFNLCQEIRKTGVLVLMLTCLTDTSYELEGFEKGADDYLTKPFDLEILRARLKALLKRRPFTANLSSRRESTLVCQQLIMDLDRCEVAFQHNPILLTPIEYDVLCFLMSNPNRVWSRSELITAVWSENEDLELAKRRIDVYIGQIRRKLGDVNGQIIKTIRGKGYLLECPDDVEPSN